jgi:hydroxymethylglutaryl-CoA reductase (NADPH)
MPAEFIRKVALATNLERVTRYIQHMRDMRGGAEPLPLEIPSDEDVSPRISSGSRLDADAVQRRWNLLRASDEVRGQLLDALTADQMSVYSHNIENFIGAVRVPIGIAGPLRVRGLFAKGDFYVPLATTEAALVSSYTRGCKTISDAGGCLSGVLNEGVSRSPVFGFKDVVEAAQFIVWATTHIEEFKRVAGTTTGHGKLEDVRFTLEGNHVFLLLEYFTGDAAGQNMVTIASEAVCQFILQQCPQKPQYWYVEGNMSGDKKASTQSFQGVRGKKVVAEASLPAALVQRRLHCTPRQMVDYYRVSALGGVLSGNIGIQGHYANGLAAVYIACGQDAACVSESSVGITRFQENPDGSLYVAVTLPNLIVGTVGGGTGLPSQRACLELMGLAGTGHANAFAEVCAALVLAGEVSIIAAMAAGQFTAAHQKLARAKDK